MARVICPACKKTGNVPDQALGKRIKCPSCGESFSTPTLPPSKATMKPAPQARAATPEIRRPARAAVEMDIPVSHAPAPVPVVPVPPTAVATVTPAAPLAQATKTCMYCGEQVLAVAMKCKHCSEILDPALRAAEEAKAIARQQHSPVVNVNQAVSTTVGGVPVRRRGFSRIVAVGLVSIAIGIAFTSNGSSGAGMFFSLLGVFLVPLGLVVALTRWMFG